MVVHEVFTPRKRPKNSQESAQACVFENSSGAQAGAPRAEGALSLPTWGDWMARGTRRTPEAWRQLYIHMTCFSERQGGSFSMNKTYQAHTFISFSL